MENQKVAQDKKAPLKYGRLYFYIFIVICLAANFYLWKPLLKYYKIL